MSDPVREQIVHTAHLLLTRLGAAGLSLEAVATELSLPADAVRAHFDTVQGLLTTLIIDAYNASAEAMEQADADAEKQGQEPGLRLLVVARALRAWALADTASFSLIYGSPVPGYNAPPETVPPASRTPAALARSVHAALAAGALQPPPRKLLATPLVLEPVVQIFGHLPPEPFEELLDRGIVLWSSLIGLLSFSVLNRTHESVRDQDAFFDFGVAVAAEAVGLKVPLP